MQQPVISLLIPHLSGEVTMVPKRSNPTSWVNHIAFCFDAQSWADAWDVATDSDHEVLPQNRASERVWSELRSSGWADAWAEGGADGQLAAPRRAGFPVRW